MSDGWHRGRRTPVDPGLDLDGLRGRLASIDRAARQAGDVLDRARPDWVAWSAGKDSTVTAALVAERWPGTPIVRFDAGIVYPEVPPYCDGVADLLGLDYHVVRVADALEGMVRSGAWDMHADEAEMTWWWDTIAGPAATSIGRWGPTFAWGLRSGESKRRRMMLASHGRRGVVDRADGTRTVAPLWNWSEELVRGTLAARAIPLCPVYAKLEELGVPRVDQRLDWIVGGDALNRGRAHWLQRGWPDEWQRYSALLPRLRDHI